MYFVKGLAQMSCTVFEIVLSGEVIFRVTKLIEVEGDTYDHVMLLSIWVSMEKMDRGVMTNTGNSW